MLHALFAPTALGTVRPWSERLFFLVCDRLFGFDTAYWHVFVLLNACGVLFLLQTITLRLTASRLAAWIAPVIWAVSPGVPIDIAWLCAYNEILCPLFLLTAFLLRLQRAYVWELVVFVLGFGALEINVVYPAIALAWVLIARDRRRRWRDWGEVGGLFLFSAVYLVARSFWTTSIANGPYALRFDARIPGTFATYWGWLSVGPEWNSLTPSAHWAVQFAVVAFTLGFLLLVTRERRVSLFGLAWFAITLGPLLPLPEHVSDYYLTIPAIGTSIALAAGVGSLRKKTLRAAALVLVACLVVADAVGSRLAVEWWVDKSREVRTLVLGGETAHEKHPGKAILIDGVDQDLYGSSFAHNAFEVLGIPSVYLSPETSGRIRAADYLTPVSHYILPSGPTMHALDHDQLVVYRVAGNHLQNVTPLYRAGIRNRLEDLAPRIVDAGNPLLAYLLGPEWYPLEGSHRWMPQIATLRIGPPANSDTKLVLTGDCPAAFVEQGPLEIGVSINGRSLRSQAISRPESPFTLQFSLPGKIDRASVSLIRIELSRTTVPPGDSRHLGLAFGRIEFLP